MYLHNLIIEKPLTELDKQQSFIIYAPCNGKIKPMSEHNMPLIRDGFLGMGVCFYPVGNTLYSPVKGRLLYLTETCHELRIKAENGIIIHIVFAQDCQNILGEGFKRLVTQDQPLEVGTPIFNFNLPILQQKLNSTQSFIGIANLKENYQLYPFYHSVKAKVDPIFLLKKA